MNCKQGDLAVIVRIAEPHLQNAIGKIVQCQELLTRHGRPYWFTGEILVPGTRFNMVRDDCLRPLRDNDGEDESLGWKGVPKPVDKPVKEEA